MHDSSDTSAQRIVFISYSRQETEIARRVQAALAARGISSWLDQAELLPGNPDWQDTLRTAIKQSHALILIASPYSQASRYVRDELDLARAYQRPVYPLWVQGEVWIEAIPLGWGSTQFIDARGTNEQAGVQALIAALSPRLPTDVAAHQNKDTVQEPSPDTPRQKLNVIDLAIMAGHEIGADHHPVTLGSLYAAYIRANPNINKGKTQNSFAAIVAYHTINMRSRFYDSHDKQKLVDWLTKPVFKRVAYGQYMLLSPSELRLFEQRLKEGDPRIYQDEYDINDLLLDM